MKSRPPIRFVRGYNINEDQFFWWPLRQGDPWPGSFDTKFELDQDVLDELYQKKLLTKI
jgi:hypothetical protein